MKDVESVGAKNATQPKTSKPHNGSVKCGFVVSIISLLTLSTYLVIRGHLNLPHSLNMWKENPEEQLFNEASTLMCAQLRKKDILKHLNNLVEIGLEHGNRAIGPGFDASAKYVEDFLVEKKICVPEKQFFKVPVWSQTAVPKMVFRRPEGREITFKNNADFRLMRYGGVSSNIQSSVVLKDDCSDIENVNGKIVLMKEGGACSFFDMALSYQNNGAVGLIIVNESLSNTRIRVLDWKEGDPLIRIPVLSVTKTVGQLLEQHNDSILQITTSATLEVLDTFNVLCMIEGEVKDAVVVGSHLDSVPEGPGAVDNASGSSFTLALSALIKKPNRSLLLAWWGAEEIGLLGSYHFNRELVTKAENDKSFHYYKDHKIVLNLNFDMLGSPNHVAYVVTLLIKDLRWRFGTRRDKRRIKAHH